MSVHQDIHPVASTAGSALLDAARFAQDLSCAQASFDYVQAEWESARAVLNVRIGVSPIQCYSLPCMDELWQVLDAVDAYPGVVRHIVFSATNPGPFNLGGDLSLFILLARSRNRDALVAYGSRCLDLLEWVDQAAMRDIHMVALVQGEALGGGFESILPFHHVIFEEQACGGFPEILFNLFPGMGAWNLVARRAGLRTAEKMILTGEVLGASALHDAGLIDRVTPCGQGEAMVARVIKETEARFRGAMAARRAALRMSALDRRQLDDILVDWIDAAMCLTDKDLRMMERLVRAQLKKAGGQEFDEVIAIKAQEMTRYLPAKKDAAAQVVRGVSHDKRAYLEQVTESLS